MDSKLSDDYIAACMWAKKTVLFLPEPPAGLQKRHIYIVKICYELSKKQDEVRVTDIADAIKVTLPSITKNISTLEKKGYIKKEANSEDKRVINIVLTEKGLALYKEEVYDFHDRNSQLLKEIPEADIRLTIQTMHKIHQLMEQEYTHD